MRAGVCLALLASGVAFGDEVKLKSGGTLMGIATRDGDDVVIETDGGTFRIAASEVVSIDTSKKSNLQVFRAKLDALKPNQDAQEFLKLAEWCVEKKLSAALPEVVDLAAQCYKGSSGAGQILGMLDHLHGSVLEKYTPKFLERAATLAPQTTDAATLIGLAGASRQWKLEELVHTLMGRAQELARQEVEPRRVILLGSLAMQAGYDTDPVPFIRHAASLCIGKDVKAITELVDYAKARDLAGYVGPLLGKILEIDPNNESARRGLGYRLHQGKWLTSDEWQAAQGNVKYDYEWMSPAERDFKLREKTVRLEERLRELERDRAAFEDNRRKVERKLDQDREDQARRDRETQQHMEEAKRDIESRERRVREREEELHRYTLCSACGVYYRGSHTCLKSYSTCSACGAYYNGIHVCPHSFSYCNSCGGYFDKTHSCKK